MSEHDMNALELKQRTEVMSADFVARAQAQTTILPNPYKTGLINMRGVRLGSLRTYCHLKHVTHYIRT